MTIRCSHCGCVKFFYTLPKRDNSRAPAHHGACCAGCGKPLTLQDLMPPIPLYGDFTASRAE